DALGEPVEQRRVALEQPLRIRPVPARDLVREPDPRATDGCHREQRDQPRERGLQLFAHEIRRRVGGTPRSSSRSLAYTLSELFESAQLVFSLAPSYRFQLRAGTVAGRLVRKRFQLSRQAFQRCWTSLGALLSGACGASQRQIGFTWSSARFSLGTRPTWKSARCVSAGRPARCHSRAR